MGFLVNLVFLFVLVIGYTNADARNLVNSNIVVDKSVKGEICELCEEYSTKALFYLNQNETQIEIISILHQACSKLSSLKGQCVTIVDYYIPLFFTEVASLSPEQFCEKIQFCKPNAAVIELSKISQDSCDLCHSFVEQIRSKLKDSDTQLEIIEILQNGCNKVENMFEQCKNLVSQYAPQIFSEAQKFLETMDICTYTQACKTQVASEKSFLFTA